MINAWSLLYDELNGTMDENFPIKKQEDDVTPCKLEDIKITSLESDEYDPIVTVGSGNTAAASTNTYFVDSTDWENIKIDTSNYPVTLTGLSTDQIYTTPEDIKIDTSGLDDDLFASMDAVEYTVPPYEEPICTTNLDDLVFTDTQEYDTLNINLPNDSPYIQSFLADNDDAAAHHFTAPTPGIKSNNPRKYKEDESIKALQDYISTTYGGHYTSDTNDVQTLDLIESVGDAESFCRSNAIKYLSRYDKKGQAKRDILKALHYSLLLYHFSGQLNETTTRGYETF